VHNIILVGSKIRTLAHCVKGFLLSYSFNSTPWVATLANVDRFFLHRWTRLGHEHAQAVSVSAQIDTAHLVSAQITRRHDAVVRACSIVTPRPARSRLATYAIRVLSRHWICGTRWVYTVNAQFLSTDFNWAVLRCDARAQNTAISIGNPKIFPPFVFFGFRLELGTALGVRTLKLRVLTPSTQLNVYSPIKQTKDTKVIHQVHGRLPERPKPIYAGHPWL